MITGLTGVYHAEGSLLGELRYLVGSRIGRAHCGLCDITHGALREKPAWREARDRMGVPFRAVHLDERTPEERAASEGRTPCVLAHDDDGTVRVLVGRDELEACEGDPEALIGTISRRIGE
jgi:hypothetical protein